MVACERKRCIWSREDSHHSCLLQMQPTMSVCFSLSNRQAQCLQQLSGFCCLVLTLSCSPETQFYTKADETLKANHVLMQSGFQQNMYSTDADPAQHWQSKVPSRVMGSAFFWHCIEIHEVYARFLAVYATRSKAYFDELIWHRQFARRLHGERLVDDSTPKSG